MKNRTNKPTIVESFIDNPDPDCPTKICLVCGMVFMADEKINTEDHRTEEHLDYEAGKMSYNQREHLKRVYREYLEDTQDTPHRGLVGTVEAAQTIALCHYYEAGKPDNFEDFMTKNVLEIMKNHPVKISNT